MGACCKRNVHLGMKRIPTNLPLLLAVTGLLSTFDLAASTVRVESQDAYREAVKAAEPGDVIQLANGTWNDFEILFRGEGREGQPITLTAEEKGKVIISGQSNLRIAGKHLVVSGLVFKDGYTPTSEVISFRRNKDDLAYHSRVTETVIDGFNNPERTEADFWVIMYGKHNRFDHNHLIGKANRGVTMAVRLNTEESRENHHRIDHNYFGPRPNLGSNGGETLRIGTSHYSLIDSFTNVENNFFERCNGEVEIISNKSGHNVFRGNVFLESRGTLTLRHGNDNLVENNFFRSNIGYTNTGTTTATLTVRLYNANGNQVGSYNVTLTVANAGMPPVYIFRQDSNRVEEVLVSGCGLGESHDGGFAQLVRVPADWVIPLPEGLSPPDAMALGTAGFTAALAGVGGPALVQGAPLFDAELARQAEGRHAVDQAEVDRLGRAAVVGRDVVEFELEDLGRWPWALEEFEHLTTIRYQAPEPDPLAFERIKGARRLKGAARDRLFSLFAWRDRVARERDVPPFKVVGHGQLLGLALRKEPSPEEQEEQKSQRQAERDTQSQCAGSPHT
mgnify:CR=1 FL=1